MMACREITCESRPSPEKEISPQRFPCDRGNVRINALTPSQSLATMPSLFSPRSLRFHSPTSKKLAHPKIPMGIADDVTPQSPVEKQPIIGLIGMGAMGTMYAQQFVDAGWKKCVLPLPNPTRPPR